MNLKEKKQKVRDLVSSILSNQVQGTITGRMSYFDSIKEKVQEQLDKIPETKELDNRLKNSKAKTYQTTKEYLSDFAEICIVNLLLEDLFIKTEKQERAIFLPHCLRPLKLCQAEEFARYDRCKQCYECNIGDIVDFAVNQGYRKDKICIVGGGSVIPGIIQELHPRAIIGIACINDIRDYVEFYKKGQRDGIKLPPTQMSLLLSYGCKNTYCDLDEIKEILEK